MRTVTIHDMKGENRGDKVGEYSTPLLKEMANFRVEYFTT
jgi:hypothetical protein